MLHPLFPSSPRDPHAGFDKSMTESPVGLAAEISKLERRHEADAQGRFFVPLANAYRIAGDLDRAEVLLREGLQRHPEFVSAHIVLGRCYANRGEREAAAQEYRTVLAQDPQNVIALRSLAELAAEQGQWKEAAQRYEELLLADPMDEEARERLAQLSRPEPHSTDADALHVGGAGKTASVVVFDDASEELEAVVGEVEDGGTVITETLAELYVQQGIYDRAIDVYRELLRRRGNEPELIRRLQAVERLHSGTSVAAAGSPPESSEDSPLHTSTPVATSTIAEYLMELLAWRPASAATGSASSEGVREGADPQPPSSAAEASITIEGTAPASAASASPSRESPAPTRMQHIGWDQQDRDAWEPTEMVAEPLKREPDEGARGSDIQQESSGGWPPSRER